MLSSTIIDPCIGGLLEGPDAKQHENQLLHLLRGLHQNGVLILDKHSILSRPLTLVRAIQQNPKLNALLTTLVQDCSVQISTAANMTPTGVIHAVSERYPPDLVVSAAEPPYGAFGRAATRVHRLSDYHDSDAESRRCDWAAGRGPVLSIAELSELFRRVFRHARWIRFYDAYFASESGQAKRRRSLHLMLQNWFQECVFPEAERCVELYCSAEHASTVGLSRLRGELEELQKEFPIKFQVQVLENTNAKLHARHIQTPNFILFADPGLDFFNGDDTLRHILLKPARGDKEHLRQVRSLKATGGSFCLAGPYR